MTSPWPLGTRMKDGVASTIQLGSDEYSILLSSLGLPTPLVASLLGLINDVTIDVATMCSTPPPVAEVWTLEDLYNWFEPDKREAAWAKMLRMATAQRWPSYCEYVPQQTGALVGPVGVPVQLLAMNEGVGLDLGDWQTLPDITWAVQTAGVDLWLVYATCTTGADANGTMPRVDVVMADGTRGTALVCNPLVNVLDFREIGRGWPLDVPGTGLSTPFVPEGATWHITQPAVTGTWVVNIHHWQLTLKDPPTPEPWPAQTVVQCEAAFTAEEASAIAFMALGFPSVAAGIEQDGEDIRTILAKPDTFLDFGMTELAYIRQDTTDIRDRVKDVQGAMHGATPYAAPAVPIADGEILDVNGTSGAIIEWTSPDGAWKVMYGTPDKYLRVGRVTWGDADSWCEPVDLVVSPQYVGGWTVGVTRLAVSMFPGGTATVRKVF